jgi:lipoprotein NlpD
MRALRSAALRASAVALYASLLLACADNPPAPIEDRERGGTARPEQRYTVLRGDTLYSIAFRYGLDYRRLAAANAIAAPYTIYAGQTLALREADPQRPAPQAAAGASSPASVSPAKTGATAAPSAPPSTVRAPVAKAPAAKAPSTNAASTPAPATTAPASAPAGSPAPTPADSSPANAAVRAWSWPASGRVIRGFDANLHKGINIAGKRGDPVRAAAGGRVVYAGSGIAGYGLLLIVRHNDEYLSAYGHNDEVLVAEGSVVRAGQTIARFGNSGTDTVKLHFEIRRSGRPVDPRRLLPPR